MFVQEGQLEEEEEEEEDDDDNEEKDADTSDDDTSANEKSGSMYGQFSLLLAENSIWYLQILPNNVLMV